MEQFSYDGLTIFYHWKSVSSIYQFYEKVSLVQPDSSFLIKIISTYARTHSLNIFHNQVKTTHYMFTFYLIYLLFSANSDDEVRSIVDQYTYVDLYSSSSL